MASPEFNTLWADQRVQACATAQQTLRSVEQPDQILVTCTAPPGRRQRRH
jgi:hypothetical protein